MVFVLCYFSRRKVTTLNSEIHLSIRICSSMLMHLVFTITLWSWHYYLHFTDKDIETQSLIKECLPVMAVLKSAIFWLENSLKMFLKVSSVFMTLFRFIRRKGDYHEHLHVKTFGIYYITTATISRKFQKD